jgi:signal peptidase I
MNNEFAQAGAPAETPSQGRPWVGVIFSLLVPGFGIARGGRWSPAIVWFLGLEVGIVAVGLGFAFIPFMLAVTVAGCWLFAFLAMLYQSHCPGRMTGKHWAALVGLLALTLPVGPELVERPFKMTTRSMSPTLQGADGNGDHVIVDRMTYRFFSPRRGDLIVFRTEGIAGLRQDQFYIKRIVGMPGERLEIHDGSVFANGTRLTERDGIPAIRFVTRASIEQGDSVSGATYEVDKQSYFVLGDNSTNSLDSRYFGCIPRRNVYGKVTAIYYPFSRAGRPRYPGETGGAANQSQPFPSGTNLTSAAAGSRR